MASATCSGLAAVEPDLLGRQAGLVEEAAGSPSSQRMGEKSSVGGGLGAASGWLTPRILRLLQSRAASGDLRRLRRRSDRRDEMKGDPKEPGLCDPRHPRRPAARPRDRRGRGADLPDLDLRPRRARRAQGLRVRPGAEPHPRGAGAERRGARGRPRRPRLRLRHVGDRLPDDAGQGRRPRGAPRSNVYGGTYRYFDHVLERYGLRFSWVDTSDLDGGARRRCARDAAWSTSRRRPTR